MKSKGIIIGIILLLLFVGASVVPIISGELSGPFKYEQPWEYDFTLIDTQDGIASNDNGIFFITSIDQVHVVKLDEINNEFVYTSINGISNWEIETLGCDHVGDPFCNDNYLFVPWSNSCAGITTPTKAKCYVYSLSDLTEFGPFDLRKGDGNYMTGASSGAYYDGYYYFSTFFPEDSISYIYKFSFDPGNGFTYIESYSLGKTQVQGIEFMGEKCYFIRAHAYDDPYVYWINTNNWDVNDLGMQDLVSLSGNSKGPFEGITFDTSEGVKCVAYFGFGPTSGGPEIFEAFEFIENPPPTVSTFSVDPDSITLGNTFTISYTVSDEGGSGLKQVELWRKSTGDWEQIEVTLLADEGNGPYSGSFYDTPSVVGTYWYGIHVVDNAGSWATEDSPISGEVLENSLPTVSAFSVDPDSITLGNTFTISYTVSDEGGSGLKQVELWRKSTGDWEQIEVTLLADEGNGPYSGSFYDTPSVVGIYWYGIYVVDNAGSWATEDSPIFVEVTLEEYPHDEDSTDNDFSIPGFELIFVILAITLIFLWKRKK